MTEPPSRTVRCDSCGYSFGSDDGTGYGDCPDCGGSAKDILATGSARIDVTVELEGHLQGLYKSAARRGGKPEVTRKFGEDLHRDSGTWRQIDYTVDRPNNLYRKRLVGKDGEVIMDVDGPLDEHQGHGAARPKRQGED